MKHNLTKLPLPITPRCQRIPQSEHLKVGGLEYIEEVEPGNSKRVAYDLGPLAMAAESAAPEKTVASEKSANMTPASWLQQGPWPWINRQQQENLYL